MSKRYRDAAGKAAASTKEKQSTGMESRRVEREAEEAMQALRLELAEAEKKIAGLEVNVDEARKELKEWEKKEEEWEGHLQGAQQELKDLEVRAQRDAAAADEAVKQLNEYITEISAPTEPNWAHFETLASGYSQVSRAKTADISFLTEVLTRRRWRACDVIDALHGADMLNDVVADEKFNKLKYIFLKETLQKIYNTHWTCENIIGLMIDGGFSHRQVRIIAMHPMQAMLPTLPESVGHASCTYSKARACHLCSSSLCARRFP
eukprot:3729495-Pleurochrysis_carterae.AAC.1